MVVGKRNRGRPNLSWRDLVTLKGDHGKKADDDWTEMAEDRQRGHVMIRAGYEV